MRERSDLRFRHVRARKLRSVGWLRPKNGVFNHFLHLGLMVSRIGFMSRLKIEDASVSAVEAASGAEYLATLVRGNENGFIGLGNIKGLAIGLLVLELKIAVNACRDRMRFL